MSLESALYTLITADAGTAALIGTRCYPLVLPQDPTLPAARYAIISAVPVTTHDAPGGLVRARVQVDSYASTYAGARTLADTIRAALDGYRATSGTIRTAVREIENPFFEDVTGLTPVSIDYFIYYQEA